MLCWRRSVVVAAAAAAAAAAPAAAASLAAAAVHATIDGVVFFVVADATVKVFTIIPMLLLYGCSGSPHLLLLRLLQPPPATPQPLHLLLAARHVWRTLAPLVCTLVYVPYG